VAVRLSPAQVRKDPFLTDLAGEALNRGTGMLVLAWVDDRSWSKLIQYPIHSLELSRGNTERELDLSDYSFNGKFTAFLLAIIVHEVAYKRRSENRPVNAA
jgi:hypothetical protein